GVLPARRHGARPRRRARADPDLGTGLRVGHDPSAVLLDDRDRAASRAAAVALLHPRREHHGSADIAGIDVQVMISARPSGNPVPAWAGHTFMLDVVGAGVRVFLYEKGYLHAKTISIDSEICSIGSANLDIRSF